MFLLVGRITSLAKEKRESLLASTSTSTGGGGGGIAEDKLDDFMRQVDELRIELEREKERMDAFLIGACFFSSLYAAVAFGNRANSLTHRMAWHSQNDPTSNRTGTSTRCFASRRSSTSTCSSNSRRLRTRSCSSCARCSAWCVSVSVSVSLDYYYYYCY